MPGHPIRTTEQEGAHLPRTGDAAAAHTVLERYAVPRYTVWEEVLASSATQSCCRRPFALHMNRAAQRSHQGSVSENTTRFRRRRRRALLVLGRPTQSFAAPRPRCHDPRRPKHLDCARRASKVLVSRRLPAVTDSPHGHVERPSAAASGLPSVRPLDNVFQPVHQVARAPSFERGLAAASAAAQGGLDSTRLDVDGME
ncbi:hypothetical protein ACCO45_003041 [Purpureocillium lilacinum]|uniref:Uncharacterized protein n=1 Tax=Purpureocillium lilacinum TaxID=33203 RepID=A0ACC4DZV9_PURLI